MFSKKVILGIFSLTFLVLIAFGFVANSGFITTVFQNQADTKQDVISYEKNQSVANQKYANFESNFYLEDLYKYGAADNQGVTIEADDVTTYGYYSLYKDWAYSFDLPTSYQISFDDSWDQISSITYEVVIPHDFVNLREQLNLFDHQKVSSWLTPILMVDELNVSKEATLSYENLANYTIVLTLTLRIDRSNYNDQFIESSFGDVTLNIIDVSTKRKVNSISLSSILNAPIVTYYKTENVTSNSIGKLEQFLNYKIYSSNSYVGNELNISINFEDQVYGQKISDYGFIYNVDIQGSKQYSSSIFSKQVKLTNTVQTLLNTDSNLKLKSSSNVANIESMFGFYTNGKIDLQVLDQSKIPLSDDVFLASYANANDLLYDTNIDIWFEISNGIKTLQLPIYLTENSFGTPKDDPVNVITISSVEFASYVNEHWKILFPDPDDDYFSGKPQSVDWDEVPEDKWYSVPIMERNDGFNEMSSTAGGTANKEKHYILTSLLKLSVLDELNKVDPIVCSFDHQSTCSLADAENWRVVNTSQPEWDVAFSSDHKPNSTDTNFYDVEGSELKHDTNQVHLKYVTTPGKPIAPTELVITNPLQVYNPGYEWNVQVHDPVQASNSLKAYFTDLMNECATGSWTGANTLCGQNLYSSNITTSIEYWVSKDNVDMSADVIVGGQIVNYILNTSIDLSWTKQYIWPSVFTNLTYSLIDEEGNPVPEYQLVPRGEQVDWDLVIGIDTTTDADDYFKYAPYSSVPIDLGVISNTTPPLQNISLSADQKQNGEICLEKQFENNFMSGTWNASTTFGTIKQGLIDSCYGTDGFDLSASIYNPSNPASALVDFFLYSDPNQTSQVVLTEAIGEIENTASKVFSYEILLDPTHANSYTFNPVLGTIDDIFNEIEMANTNTEAVRLALDNELDVLVSETWNSIENDKTGVMANSSDSYLSYQDIMVALASTANGYAIDSTALLGTTFTWYYAPVSNPNTFIEIVPGSETSKLLYQTGNKVKVVPTFNQDSPLLTDARYVHKVTPTLTYGDFSSSDNVNEISIFPDYVRTTQQAKDELMSTKVLRDSYSEPSSNNQDFVFDGNTTYGEIYQAIASQYEITFSGNANYIGDSYTKYISDPRAFDSSSIQNSPLTVVVNGDTVDGNNYEKPAGFAVPIVVSWSYELDKGNNCLPFVDPTIGCASNIYEQASSVQLEAPDNSSGPVNEFTVQPSQIVNLNMAAKASMDQALELYLEDSFGLSPEYDANNPTTIDNKHDLTYNELMGGIRGVITSTGPEYYISPSDWDKFEIDFRLTFRDETNHPTYESLGSIGVIELNNPIPDTITGFYYTIDFKDEYASTAKIAYSDATWLVLQTSLWGEVAAVPGTIVGQNNALKIWLILLTFVVLIIAGIITGNIINKRKRGLKLPIIEPPAQVKESQQ